MITTLGSAEEEGKFEPKISTQRTLVKDLVFLMYSWGGGGGKGEVGRKRSNSGSMTNHAITAFILFHLQNSGFICWFVCLFIPHGKSPLFLPRKVTLFHRKF